jgi:hypothetical protein
MTAVINEMAITSDYLLPVTLLLLHVLTCNGSEADDLT